MALALTGGAAASDKGGGQHLSSKPGVIVAKGHSEQGLRYSSTTVDKGGKLTIVNNTPAPHTLSLVQESLVPHSQGSIKKCFHPGHICRKIAKWHKFDGHALNKNPVKVGASGWSTEGNLHKTGDSYAYGAPFGPTHPITREVHAPHGSTLYFICAIHPWMHGEIHVR